jgi:hypothetical protein
VLGSMLLLLIILTPNLRLLVCVFCNSFRGLEDSILETPKGLGYRAVTVSITLYFY